MQTGDYWTKVTRLGLALAVLVAGTGIGSSQIAPGEVSAPAVRQNIDANGVDVATGTFHHRRKLLTIGPGWPHGLQYTQFKSGAGWRDNFVGTLQINGPRVVVSIGEQSEDFVQAGASWASLQGNGSSLTRSASLNDTLYTYISSSGVIARFRAFAFQYAPYSASQGRIEQLTYPNGIRLS